MVSVRKGTQAGVAVARRQGSSRHRVACESRLPVEVACDALMGAPRGPEEPCAQKQAVALSQLEAGAAVCSRAHRQLSLERRRFHFASSDRQDAMEQRPGAPPLSRRRAGIHDLGSCHEGFRARHRGSGDPQRRVPQGALTAKNCQLVLIALKPGEEIGAEVHTLDQSFRVEQGSGQAILDGVATAIRAGFAVLVPAGVRHNIVKTGTEQLKLYTLYAPPNHRDGVVHHTRADAESDTEQFDGRTSEQVDGT